MKYYRLKFGYKSTKILVEVSKKVLPEVGSINVKIGFENWSKTVESLVKIPKQTTENWKLTPKHQTFVTNNCHGYLKLVTKMNLITKLSTNVPRLDR